MCACVSRTGPDLLRTKQIGLSAVSAANLCLALRSALVSGLHLLIQLTC